MKRTNVMLGENQLKKLKKYAREKGRTMGHLVREAVDRSYESKDALEDRQKVALRAYEEGLISLGKLAEVLGLDPVSARVHLGKMGIVIRTQNDREIATDAANA